MMQNLIKFYYYRTVMIICYSIEFARVLYCLFVSVRNITEEPNITYPFTILYLFVGMKTHTEKDVCIDRTQAKYTDSSVDTKTQKRRHKQFHTKYQLGSKNEK